MPGYFGPCSRLIMRCMPQYKILFTCRKSALQLVNSSAFISEASISGVMGYLRGDQIYVTALLSKVLVDPHFKC